MYKIIPLSFLLMLSLGIMAAEPVVVGATDESIEKLFEVTHLSDAMTAGFEQGVKGGQVGMDMAKIPPDMAKKMAKGQARMMAIMKDEISYDKIKYELIKVYRKKYTQEEIDQLIKFFETDLGKKYATAQIEIMPEIQDVLLPKIKAVLPQAMKVMMEEMGKP